MGTDQLIELLSNVCNKLIPVLGFILLIFVIFFFRHLITILKTMNTTLITTNKMIEDCNIQVKKLDKPLATVNELSDTVDQVHTATKNAVSSTIAVILNNLENIRDWIMKHKEKETDFMNDDFDLSESEESNHE